MATDTATELKSNKCEDRIDEHLQGRLQDMRRFNHKYELAYSVGERRAAEHLLQYQQEDILEVRTESINPNSNIETIRVLLSTGGPADWFDVEYHKPTHEIDGVVYTFQDWFDYADQRLRGKDLDAVRQWVETVVCLE